MLYFACFVAGAISPLLVVAVLFFVLPSDDHPSVPKPKE